MCGIVIEAGIYAAVFVGHHTFCVDMLPDMGFFSFSEVDICITLAIPEVTEIFLPLAPECWD